MPPPPPVDSGGGGGADPDPLRVFGEFDAAELAPHPMARGSERLLTAGLAAALGGTGREHLRVRRLEERYQPLDTLGSGSYGTVMRCTRLSDQKEVAVKELDLDDVLSNRRHLQRALGEAACGAVLVHPALSPLLGTLCDGEMLYLVHELCPGRPLSAVAPDPGVADDVARQLTSAVAYLHANGVVHRDVKPANVVYDASARRARLVDFGFAKRAGGSDAAAPVPTTPCALSLQAAPLEAVRRFVLHQEGRRGAARTPVPLAELRGADVYGAGWCVFALLAAAATRARHPALFAPRGEHRDLIDAKRCAPDFAAADCAEGGGAVTPAVREWVALLLGPDPDARPAAADARRLWLRAVGALPPPGPEPPGPSDEPAAAAEPPRPPALRRARSSACVEEAMLAERALFLRAAAPSGVCVA